MVETERTEEAEAVQRTALRTPFSGLLQVDCANLRETRVQNIYPKLGVADKSTAVAAA